MTILYFHLNFAPFIVKDIAILESHHNVKSKCLEFTGSIIDIYTIFLQIIFILKHRHKANIFITQFAGYQSVIPTFLGKLFGLKNYIVLGGTDCNWLPSINYGNYNKRLLRWATEYSLKNAYHLIPVNKELIECEYTYTELDFKKQGYKSFINNINTSYTVIPNGIDLDLYIISNQNRLKNSFITICSVLEDEKRRLVKGIDLMLKIAVLMPEINITIIGGTFPIGMMVPTNIKTLPFIKNDGLPNLFNRHQFYLQLSLTEGFPNAVIEAMACGCVPIVSSVGAMPDIVQEFGYILVKKDVELLQTIIIRAMKEYNEQKPLKVRSRAENFDINYRKERLLNLLKEHSP